MRLFTSAVLAAACAVAVSTTTASAQAFTYQGELTSAGLPANGNYDFQFRVFDAPTAGTQIGGTNAVLNLPVTQGRFTTQLGMLSSANVTASMHLEVSVRPAGSTGAYTPLTPRTQITPAPTALRSLTERWSPVSSSQIKTDTAITNVMIGTAAPFILDAALTVQRTTTSGSPYAGMYVNGTDAGTQAYYGWGTAGTSRVEAIVSGTNGAFRLAMAGVDALHVSSTGLVGLGAFPTGTARLQVTGASSTTGQAKAGSFAYQTPQTRVLTIPAEAFHSIDSSHPGVFGGVTAGAYLADSVANGNLIAPVSLPDNATIVEFIANVYDNTTTEGMTISLAKRGVLSMSGVSLALATSGVATSSASAYAVNDLTISDPLVNNATSVYYVNVNSPNWRGPLMGLLSAQIVYTVPEPD